MFLEKREPFLKETHKNVCGDDKYSQAFDEFLGKTRIISANLPEREEVFCFEEGKRIVDQLISDQPDYPFVASPENPELERELRTPRIFREFFETRGTSLASPRPIVNSHKTTLFISAGVQILEDAMYNEAPIPSGRLFVAQPVFRTHFINKEIGEGTSTSFVNVATESVNQSPEAHFEGLHDWFDFLQSIGLKRSKFHFLSDSKETKWGGKEITLKRVKIRYDGLSIGDAAYIDDFPQTSRDGLQISDIGFGLERIRWILRGGSCSELICEDENYLASDRTIDHAKTLALLAGAGVKPHYKAHGYRFRQLSKRLVGECTEKGWVDLDSLLDIFYTQWGRWINLPLSKKETIDRVKKENMRNFNAELLKRLRAFYADVGVDINKPTNMVVKLLKGTSADPSVVQKTLKEMGEGVSL